MDQTGIAKLLTRYVEKTYKSRREAAEKWSVSPSFVSAVLKGNKRPTAAMLKDIGYECEAYCPNYVKVKK